MENNLVELRMPVDDLRGSNPVASINLPVEAQAEICEIANVAITGRTTSMLIRSPALPRRSTTEQIIEQSRNWSEFWDALVQLDDTSQQGDAFERVTQLYLQTQPEYQSKLRNVWRWSEMPIRNG